MTTAQEISKWMTQNILELVAANQGTTQTALDFKLLDRVNAYNAALPKDGTYYKSCLYYAGGSYFYDRLTRLVKKGLLRKVIFKGTARYFTPEFIAGMDLANPLARLVAADWVQEMEDREDLAAILRGAIRGM